MDIQASAGYIPVTRNNAMPWLPQPTNASSRRRPPLYIYTSQGQGAGQAIKDVAALITVLLKETTPADVFERLKLYEAIGNERADTILTATTGKGRLRGSDIRKGKNMAGFTCPKKLKKYQQRDLSRIAGCV
ncbi:uncharacterized protein B0T23DRAFT_418092 [Neurospora hispaniola]|uniref:Uncharacterized protein n=1 Tax=Neurospora hispaniola TaxID=588809 RepID=A0AAJ0MTX2_9PEZI|nr:hypothetical protein B0T23DRAFT_418092 [Neurospora hispaniola]